MEEVFGEEVVRRGLVAVAGGRGGAEEVGEGAEEQEGAHRKAM